MYMYTRRWLLRVGGELEGLERVAQPVAKDGLHLDNDNNSTIITIIIIMIIMVISMIISMGYGYFYV